MRIQPDVPLIVSVSKGTLSLSRFRSSSLKVNRMSSQIRSLLVFCVLAISFASLARAGVVETNSSSSTPFTVSANLNSDPLATDVFTQGNSGPYAAPYGAFSTSGIGLQSLYAGNSPPGGLGIYGFDNQTPVLLVSLNTAASPTGYDLSQINTYASWGDQRQWQSYTVSYHVVGTPSNNFVTLASPLYQPGGLLGNTDVSLALTGVHNVDQLQFSFTNNGYGPNQSAYSQITVFGTPTPEPSTIVLSLLAIGACVLVSRRRK